MGMLAELLANRLTKYLAAAFAGVLILIGAYVKGREDGSALTQAKVAEERHKWELKVAETQSQYNSTIDKITEDYKTKVDSYQAEIAKLSNSPSKTKVVERVVQVYVPADVDTIVPIGFVRLHNTAAEGDRLADVKSADAEQPSGKKLSDVAATVATNYYQCNATREQLIALQRVVAEFQDKQKELTK
jgi:hypothetical protein